MKKLKELNQRQKIFVKEYQVDFNATRAAKAAGYSEKSAFITGHNLLRLPSVQAELNKSIEVIATKTDATVQKILKELCAIAFFDIRKVMTWDETSIQFIPADQIDEASARAISDVRETVTSSGGSRAIKSHDKLKALELLGKYIGMFNFTESKEEKDQPSFKDIINMIEKSKAKDVN